MKKLGFYAVVVIALVFTLWFCTKDGMRPDDAAAPPVSSVGSIMLESRSLNRRVRVEDPEDIRALSETLSTLSEENGVMVDLEEDFPEHMRDWTIEWLSKKGESQAVVQISRVGTVFRGDQCFNFLGGDVFDMDYLRGLLLGLPEDGEPEKLLDMESVEWVNLHGGDAKGGKIVTICGAELDELKSLLSGMSFYRGAEAYGYEGCGYSLDFFDRDGRETGPMEISGDTVEFDGYYYRIEGGRFEDEWLERMLATMPEAAYGERFPIVDFKHDDDIIDFSISDGTAADGRMVRITDPELLECLEGPVREMEFRACEPCGSDKRVYWLNRYFADDYYDAAIKIVDEETIEYGGWLYKLMDGRKFDLELYAELSDPDGPYKDHPGVLYWKQGDPPMPAVTPRPDLSASADPEPTPAGTAGPHIMEDAPEEKVFDFDGGYVIMEGPVIIKGEEFEKLAAELRDIRFVRREQCGEDANIMHATGSDLEPYHGDPLYSICWYDKGGHIREEFTARTMGSWIEYGGYFYEAKEGGIDLDNLKRLRDEMPEPQWYDYRPVVTVSENISEAKCLWMVDQDHTRIVAVTDPELLERICGSFEGKEFFAQPEAQCGMDEEYAYELEWYKGVLGPHGGDSLERLRVKDEHSITGGYKLREGEIDMELLDELAKPDGKYSDKEGVKFAWKKDLLPEGIGT